MNKKTLLLAGLALGCSMAVAGVGFAVSATHSGNNELTMVKAAEDDTHDFAQSLSQLLNNNASISSINIDAPSYPVKKIIITCKYNKSIDSAVTISASVGGVSAGSDITVGNNFNGTKTFDLSAAPKYGAISIDFTNNCGDGTGKGTFQVTKVRLVEGNAGTVYSVTDNVDHGTLSSTAQVAEDDELDITIIPDAHYSLPEEVSVTMGGNDLEAGSDYLYDNDSGDFYIAEVTGDVVITGACVEDPKYTVTYVAGTHGTGTDYVVADQYVGTYTLIDYSDLEAEDFEADAGYIFKCYEVGGVEHEPGDSIELAANTIVTVLYEELPRKIEMSYSDFSTTSYAANNGDHVFAGYTINTNQVMRQSSLMQFQKSNGTMYNKTAFGAGIKMVALGSASGTYTLTFSATTSGSAGNVSANIVTLGGTAYATPATAGTYKYFHLKANSTDTVRFASIGIYGENEAALLFAKMYLGAYTCTSSGASAPAINDGFTAANIETLYERLPDGDKTLLQNAVKNHSADYGTDKLKEFGERYYWIVSNHGTADYDFMNLAGTVSFSASSAGFEASSAKDVSLSLVITVIAVGGVAAAGLFFVQHKRRKEF